MGDQLSDYAATFSLVDADGDGRISAPELVRLMEVLGRPITGDAAESAITKMDADGDRLISLEEFASYLSTHR